MPPSHSGSAWGGPAALLRDSEQEKGHSRENEANLPSRVSLGPHTPRRKVASGGLPRLVDKHPARARKFSREFRRAQLPDTPGGPERAR